MAVSNDNKRVPVKLSKEEYEIVEQLAKADCRSVSNYIYKVLKANTKELNQQKQE